MSEHTGTKWMISSASQPCSGNSTRERSAYPLRQPGEEKECPPTTETEPCKLNSNCFHYSYNITGETPTERQTTCRNVASEFSGNIDLLLMKPPPPLQIGVPVSWATVQCVETASKPACWTVCVATVNPWTSSSAKRWDVCHFPLSTAIKMIFKDTEVMQPHGIVLQLGLERKWQMNASCVVECPVNCQLSDWSPWSDCSHTCGLSGMSLALFTQPYTKLDFWDQMHPVILFKPWSQGPWSLESLFKVFSHWRHILINHDCCRFQKTWHKVHVRCFLVLQSSQWSRLWWIVDVTNTLPVLISAFLKFSR